MPKVTEEHKEARREQILAGAQRAFARHGYEGATVARLEEETGLSRGAIFNYYESKEALFVELVRRSSDRFVEIWLGEGYRALLEAVLEEDPEWLSVQVEAARRVRTDGASGSRSRGSRTTRRASARRGTPGCRRSRAATSRFKSSSSSSACSRTASPSRGSRTKMPDLDQLMTLIETGVAPR